MHTTKRHTDTEHRYRIVMPLSHKVELPAKEFKEFMRNIYSWLPFGCDEQTSQRARKWLTHKGKHWYNDGELLDTLQFIPKTKKAEQYKRRLTGQANLNGIERWFINSTEEGNRSNMLMRYAYFLVREGLELEDVRSRVMGLNSRLAEPLEEAELLATVIVTTHKAIIDRDKGN